MTTDKLPEVDNDGVKKVAPAQHSSAEMAIKQSAIESESKGGRKIKFIPQSNAAKMSYAAAGFVAIILVLLVVVMLSGGGTKKTGSQSPSSPVVLKDLEPDNNSSGYVQSPTANFSSYSLNLNLTQPALIKSASFEAKLGEQISWDDGFAVMAVSVDRDYRPASEFNYKKIAEAGDELVRVNLLVGNGSTTNMLTGYEDLAFYASAAGMENVKSERVSEDTYSPKDGQVLGGKQTQKISLHFRVKRGQEFALVKSKTFTQNNAKVKNGEEKNPVLQLKINL